MLNITNNKIFKLCSSAFRVEPTKKEVNTERKKLIWQVILCVFDLVRPPDSTEDQLGGWFDTFPVSYHKLVLCGGGAICSTIWKIRNAACFKQQYPSDLLSLYSNPDAWAILQKEQDRRNLEES